MGLLYYTSVLLLVLLLKNNTGYKTPDLMLKGLENAINNTDDKAIIQCYPDFIQNHCLIGPMVQ